MTAPDPEGGATQLADTRVLASLLACVTILSELQPSFMTAAFSTLSAGTWPPAFAVPTANPMNAVVPDTDLISSVYVAPGTYALTAPNESRSASVYVLAGMLFEP